jgi:hypothetical protein
MAGSGGGAGCTRRGQRSSFALLLALLLRLQLPGDGSQLARHLCRRPLSIRRALKRSEQVP